MAFVFGPLIGKFGGPSCEPVNNSWDLLISCFKQKSWSTEITTSKGCLYLPTGRPTCWSSVLMTRQVVVQDMWNAVTVKSGQR
ncbi:unnamed protein product [Protopolystoma xenopodis]|uniref:Uncharacterized protein n=1 Tax=Protopolystoma xenopodis TaxID=117903 RepID=A0A3S5FF13_9PLAT|nr:unnamed protein product [Protopolystoma xenopodis]